MRVHTLKMEYIAFVLYILQIEIMLRDYYYYDDVMYCVKVKWGEVKIKCRAAAAANRWWYIWDALIFSHIGPAIFVINAQR